MRELLERLCALNAVSSWEDEVRAFLLAEVEPHADRLRVDALGNLIAWKKGWKHTGSKLLLTAHMDEVGLMIRQITDDGYLKFDTVGAIDRRVLLGKPVLVGPKRVPGVVGLKAYHLVSREEEKSVPKLDEFYIDIGARDRAGAEAQVALGDTAAFDSDAGDFGAGLFQGKALGSRLGCAVLLTLLRDELPMDCTFVFTAQKEVGARGAFGAAFATVFSQAVAGIGSLIYIGRHYPELKWSREEGRLSASHCLKLCNMGIPMGLQCSITAIGSVVLQGAVNGLGSSIVAAQTAGSKAAQFLSVPLESIGTAMTTYASQNMGAHDLKRVDRGVNTALGIGCVYSVASFLILRVLDVPLISLFLESSEVEIMANARSFIFWNSVFYIPLAVLIIYRYTIQGLGYSGLAMFAGVAEMVARAMVGFWFVPLWGYFAACIANPVAWFFACFFLIPAYFAVRNRLMKENAYGVGD